MKIRECYECGAKPCVERDGGRIYIFCPVCGASHASYGDNHGMTHAIADWNEAMGWLEKANVPFCSGCRPVGGPCKECDVPL